jgi:DNA-binding NarL/FixJ family response regulator
VSEPSVADGAIRIVVVDDHPVVREGLRSFLGSRDGLEVVGEAGDVDEAVAVVDELAPDVVLLDLVLPGGGGVAALPRLLALHPSPRVVVLTSFGGDEQVLAALRAGAAGWLGKDVPPAELDAAIRTVHRGGSVLDPAIAARVLAEVSSPGGGDPGLDQLTTREREVLGLLGLGLSNKDLAARLFVAEKTVKTHVSAVLAKLHLTDRTQAALYAVHHGLVEDDPPNRS